MTDAITKLREPAALGAAAFAALEALAGVISLLFTGGSFSDIAYGDTGNLLSFEIAAGIAVAVYLANHVGPALEKARLVTLVALVTAAAAGVFGLVSFFAGFGAQGPGGTGKLAYFLAGAGGAIVLGLAGWYTWLTWQTHAPARPSAPITPAAPGGWAPPQGPQGGPAPQAGPGPQQGAGFGWKPGNAAEQTAYLPPQGGGQNPQTLQAQQSASGSYAVPPQQQGGQPGRPGGGERTQMIPPVPPTMQEYAPDPQPWQPQGGQPQGGQQGQPGGVPQPPPTRPMNQGDGQSAEGGPFGVGNWQ